MIAGRGTFYFEMGPSDETLIILTPVYLCYIQFRRSSKIRNNNLLPVPSRV